MSGFRTEKDLLGERQLPADALYGIHTSRAMDNFAVSGVRVPARLVHAYAEVKLACVRVNQRLGYLDEHLAKVMETACREMSRGELDPHVMVDAYQGGAGTSTNLNVCEVLANRTLVLLGHVPGEYTYCDPIAHFNMHQSTNDTYPTALRVAVLRALKELEEAIVGSQEICQVKEKEFAGILKVARTEMMDAVPMTLGRTFGAWAEALSRDRWRVFKCTERVRVVNLGGTAIGTGLGAPREYIFQATDELRSLTGLPVARAENLVEATQNLDVWVEVMGMLKAHAMTLAKIAGDLRLMAMGPDAGLGEITLPALQTGSSQMPGKINPVIPELMQQVGMQVAGLEQTISWAVASGQLELNAFLPLIALDLLTSLDLLIHVNSLAVNRCLRHVQANAERCRELALRSSALVTVLVPVLGYHQAQSVGEYMRAQGVSLPEAAEKVAGLAPEKTLSLLTTEAVNALGFTDKP